MSTSCRILPIGKRRDGGMRFWCVEHRGDATAKYGVEAQSCRYAGTRFGYASPTKLIRVSDFPGGVALWGAVPPVYDTTSLPLDAGIHVHARYSQGADKVIDETFQNVELEHQGHRWRIEELDAIYQMVSSVLGVQTIEAPCTHCGALHLDKDWFGLHPHSSHLCSHCGRHFKHAQRGVGNPVAALAKHFPRPRVVSADKAISIKQADFPGGIRIWGSNPAIVWTSKKEELAGIHVHTYDAEGRVVLDETFKQASIDGVRLSAHWVRVLMAQNSLPHIRGRVVALSCVACGALQADRGQASFTPRTNRSCRKCGASVTSGGRLKKVIANPVLHSLSKIAKRAIRPPSTHDLGLIPECP